MTWRSLGKILKVAGGRRALSAVVLAPVLAGLPATGTAGAQPPVGRGETADEGHSLALGATGLERDALIAGVLARNPTLAARCAEVGAARRRGAQASSLADPSISLRVAPLSASSTDVDFGQELRIAQRLPYPGWRGLQRELSEAEAESLARDHGTLGSDLALEASMLFDDLWETDRALELNAEHTELLRELREIVTTRYVAGLASQQDALQAEVELTHREHERMVLTSRHEVLRARLNTLLHLAPRAQLPPPILGPAAPPPSRDEERQLIEEALLARSELARLDATLRARRAGIELARLERRPGFEVNASYSSMWAATEHRWMVGAAVNLPVRGERIRAGIAEMEARLAAVESERRALVDRVRLEVTISVEELREAHHILALSQERLLPAARDQVQAAVAGFQSGRNDFQAVIMAERNLRDAQMGDHEARAEFGRRRAELDHALGRMPQATGCAPVAELEGEDS
jgi:outer membrane protein, heavy metal efflux system